MRTLLIDADQSMRFIDDDVTGCMSIAAGRTEGGFATYKRHTIRVIGVPGFNVWTDVFAEIGTSLDNDLAVKVLAFIMETPPMEVGIA